MENVKEVGNFIEFLRHFQLNDWYLLVGSGNTAVIVVIVFHYLVEFIAIGNVNLSTAAIVFHFVGIFVGTILYFLEFRKSEFANSAIINSSVFTTILIALLLAKDALIVRLLLFLAGFTIPYTLSSIFKLNNHIFQNNRYNGKLFGLLALISTILFLLGTGTINRNRYLLPLILAIVTIGNIILLRKSEVETSKPSFVLTKYLQYPKMIPFLISTIIAGFFWVSSYYLPILYFRFASFNTDVRYFYLIQALTTFIVLPVLGWFSDIIGRKITILAGFYVQTLIFLGLLLNSLNVVDITSTYIELVVFPILSTISFLSSCLIMALYAIEFPPTDDIGDRIQVFVMFLSFGMILSVLLLSSLYEYNLEILSIVVVIILFLATNITFQMQETIIKSDKEKSFNYLKRAKKMVETS